MAREPLVLTGDATVDRALIAIARIACVVARRQVAAEAAAARAQTETTEAERPIPFPHADESRRDDAA